MSSGLLEADNDEIIIRSLIYPVYQGKVQIKYRSIAGLARASRTRRSGGARAATGGGAGGPRAATAAAPAGLGRRAAGRRRAARRYAPAHAARAGRPPA